MSFKDYESLYDPNYKPYVRKSSTGYKKSRSKKKKPKKPFVALITIIAVIITIIVVSKNEPEVPQNEPVIDNISSYTTITENTIKNEREKFIPLSTDSTFSFGDEVDSQYAILINATDKTIVAEKGANTVIYPASMTKIMTLIVAVESGKNINDTYTFSSELIDPFVREGASMAGFSSGETVTFKDLLYGAILPSGADATAGIADFVCGSEEKFVELMNKKAEELGLKNTHFTNPSGLHNAQHYSTVYETAIITEYAINNPDCREILSTYQYTTTITPEHPEGIPLESTLFSRMYGTEPETATILGGKTGYTDEAGNCMASFAKSASGKEYIFISAAGGGKWRPIFDSIEMYKKYAK